MRAVRVAYPPLERPEPGFVEESSELCVPIPRSGNGEQHAEENCAGIPLHNQETKSELGDGQYLLKLSSKHNFPGAQST